jgi:alpha-2-macroglobulin
MVKSEPDKTFCNRRVFLKINQNFQGNTMRAMHLIKWLLFFTLISLTACDKKSESPPAATPTNDTAAAVVEANWAEHLVDYPRRWVATDAPIYIRFSHPVVSAENVDKAADDDLVDLDIDTPINLVFTAEDELRITPAERFPNGKKFRLTLTADGLAGVDQSLDDFVLELETVKQEFDLQVNSLIPVPDSEGKMQLTGTITTADTTDLDQVKKILTVEVNKKNQDIEWTEEIDHKTFRFTINNIARTESDSKLELMWNGASLGSDKKGAREIEVPKLNQFKVTGVQVVHHPDTHVEIRFSDELDENQNLSGLVKVNGSDVDMTRDGSVLRYFPKKVADGQHSFVISKSIINNKSQTLDKEYSEVLVLSLTKPSVKFIGATSILPNAKQLSVPFEAAGVDSVQVIAFKVFENNIGQYLQDNTISNVGYSAPTQTGRYLWRKTFKLPEVPRDGSQRFNLDLTQLMQEHPAGLLRLELQIDRSNSVYNCEGERPTEPVAPMPKNSEGGSYYEEQDGEPEWYRQYYESSGHYDWDDRWNPCHDAYFSYGNNETSAKRNFLASNIGLIAKLGGDQILQVITTEIDTAKPMANTGIDVFNYQNQLIGKGSTDSQGIVSIKTDGTPFYIEATNKEQRGYLRVRKTDALPTNQFDVGGEQISNGLKGFIYGERDVWRPGDDIFLSFILEDKQGILPANHPVKLDLFDPSGKKVVSETSNRAVGDIYTFAIKTEETAPTGNYRAVVHLGNHYFDKMLKIEMVVPNRLKVDVTPESTPLLSSAMPINVNLFAQWLHGGTAKKLKADSEVKLFAKKTSFDGYGQFDFDDDVRKVATSSIKVFDENLDEKGNANFKLSLALDSVPPGKVTANFITRVFEESGNFSTVMRPFDYLQFDTWFGLNVPKGDGYMGALSRDVDHELLIQVLNSEGKPETNRAATISVYELGWRWWWDEEEENLADYFSERSHTPITEENLTSDENGQVKWKLDHNRYDWGRHLIRVCDGNDAETGHCTSQEVYLGWSWDDAGSNNSATQMMLSSDKEKYAVGETAKVRLPKATQGRVLMSLETGSKIIKTGWLDVSADQRDLEIPITDEMAPNVYVSLMLLLPHQERKADAPIRIYGVIPLIVEDPKTKLNPQLDVAEKVRPESEFVIKVSEKDQRAMTYTLAVVDEGLLGLTDFHVPDAHQYFFKREALGVRTWDLFDLVVGAYGASLERVLSIGGSDAAVDADRKRRERRFPPIVKFVGAFQLKAGETREHKIKLPPYMGAVRVMLVAADTATKTPAYGKVETTVKVTQPVVAYATLPRVLGPGEEVNLPVNVFVSEADIKAVDVSVEANEIFTIVEGKTQLSFTEPGDAIAMLKLKVNDRIGKGHVKVVASAGQESATQEIYIDSRTPNLPAVVSESKLLAPGESWESPLAANGMFGTNQASVEVSSLPPLNLDKRLQYLIAYPHGCIEQTTSSVFPQLRLNKLMDLDKKQKQDIDKNIKAGIRRLSGFQTATGGFSYWPGESYVNDWGSTYAGHFLLEAKRAGYAVPDTLLMNWINYQRSAARISDGRDYYYYESVQAYRLYTLALANSAEMSAMNRLREELNNDDERFENYRATSRWLLALAYQQVGLKDVAAELMTKAGVNVPAYDDWGYTYGSDLRDRAILLSAMMQTQAASEATWQMAEQVAKGLSSEYWYSTQSLAWALMAMSDFAEQNADSKNPMRIAIKEEGETEWKDLSTSSTMLKQTINTPKISVRNDSDKNLRVLVSNRGIPANMYEQPKAEGLNIKVSFMSMDNKPLDISKLQQGTDFIAEVTVGADFPYLRREKLEDLSLTAVVPSGWQIRNERLEGSQLPKGIDYMDIRDDRVMAYFSLWRDYYWYYRYSDRNQTSVTVRLILNASYAGKFYLPGWQTSAMYNETLQAGSSGTWVEVVAK